MKKMKKLSLIFAIMPLLMAMRCNEDDMEPRYYQNQFKISVTPQMSYTINDTIWIEGIASSKAFDTNINDSIIYLEHTLFDQFSILKFITPNQNSNCKDALNKFQLINDPDLLTFAGYCENADLTIISVLSPNELTYKYKIGLKALHSGDYVISWTTGSIITNLNRYEEIISNYPIVNQPNTIGFDKCGHTSSRYLNQSNHEYYFKVN